MLAAFRTIPTQQTRWALAGKPYLVRERQRLPDLSDPLSIMTMSLSIDAVHCAAGTQQMRVLAGKPCLVLAYQSLCDLARPTII